MTEKTEDPTGDDPTDDPAPHGDGTDWKAEARKWEKRAKTNSDAAARLQEIEDAQKSAAEKAEEAAAAAIARAEKAELRALKLEVAQSKGLPPTLASRLTGSTEDELSADADQLLELIPNGDGGDPPPDRQPRTDLRGGNDPTTDPATSDDVRAAIEALPRSL